MTGRFSIRSGTYKVLIGGVPDGLTLWGGTIAELLSAQGYATGIWGKWHLGSTEEGFPMHQGFDEWYSIPRTYDEAMWPSLNEINSMWPSVGNKQGWSAKVVHPEHLYEARKGEKARQIAELTVNRRRTMEAEITTRAMEFIKRHAKAGKPFYAYVAFSLVHMPTLPNPEFAGRTGNGDWADCLAEMDYRTGQILDAIEEAGKTTRWSSSPATTVRKQPNRWCGPVGFLPRHTADLQPRGIPYLCGRPAVRRQVAQLESAPDLAGEHVRGTRETPLAEGHQSPHRLEGRTRRGRPELLGRRPGGEDHHRA
jgi:hypothetical protein